MRDEIAFKVDFERAAPTYRKLPEPVRRILRLCDGTRGLTQVVALSPIDAERTEAVLRRLAQLGIIQPGGKAAPATAKAANATQSAPAPSVKATPAPSAKAAPAPSAKAVQAPAQSAKVAPAKSAAAKSAAVSAPAAKAKDAPITKTDITTAAPATHAATHESAQVLAFTHDEEEFFGSSIDHLVTDEFTE